MHKFFYSKLNKFSKSEKGFTIVELLVVIAIIAVLTAIALPFFFNQTEKAAKAAVQSDVRNTNTSLMAYLASNPDASQEELEAQSVVSNGNTITVSGSGYTYTICASSEDNPEETFGFDSSTGQYSEGCDNSNGVGPSNGGGDEEYVDNSWTLRQINEYMSDNSYSLTTNWTGTATPIVCDDTTYTFNTGSFTADGAAFAEPLTITITGYEVQPFDSANGSCLITPNVSFSPTNLTGNENNFSDENIGLTFWTAGQKTAYQNQNLDERPELKGYPYTNNEDPINSESEGGFTISPRANWANTGSETGNIEFSLAVNMPNDEGQWGYAFASNPFATYSQTAMVLPEADNSNGVVTAGATQTFTCENIEVEINLGTYSFQGTQFTLTEATQPYCETGESFAENDVIVAVADNLQFANIKEEYFFARPFGTSSSQQDILIDQFDGTIGIFTSLWEESTIPAGTYPIKIEYVTYGNQYEGTGLFVEIGSITIN
jgi:type IV pilus assembly protein PilA